MHLRTPALLLSSQGSFPAASVHPCSFCTSSRSPPVWSPVHARTRRPQFHGSQCRRYATVNNGQGGTKSDHNGDPHRPWPDSGGRHPTPYEIFGLSKDSAYSKVRFYELVKQYHPDRNHADTQAARELMLERYRLIITANSILSDSQKKKAYDDHGFGWQEPRAGPPHYRYTTMHRWRTESDYRTTFEDDPMYNATWEDWERWYQRQHERERAYQRGEEYTGSSPFSSSFFTSRHRPRHTVYLNNNMFISIVFLFAALGGIGQATRAGEAAKTRTERLNLVNEQTTAQLMQARQDSRDAMGEGKGNRIRRFVKGKEDQYSDDEFDGRVLRAGVDGGICASGAVQARDEPRFWEKPPENR